jgi:hypothetical protein
MKRVIPYDIGAFLTVEGTELKLAGRRDAALERLLETTGAVGGELFEAFPATDRRQRFRPEAVAGDLQRRWDDLRESLNELAAQLVRRQELSDGLALCHRLGRRTGRQQRVERAVLRCEILPGDALEVGHPEQPLAVPVVTLGPLKIDLKVIDQRSASERDKIGVMKNSYGMEMAPVVSKREITQIIKEMLVTQLNEDGHSVVSEGAEDAQVIIQVEADRFWSDLKMGLIDIKVNGIISTQVAIIDPKSKKRGTESIR